MSIETNRVVLRILFTIALGLESSPKLVETLHGP